MTNDEIIQYYDYLIRLATSKCNSQNDAEDLAKSFLWLAGLLPHNSAGLSFRSAENKPSLASFHYRVATQVVLVCMP